jgi:hypothetical protein
MTNLLPARRVRPLAKHRKRSAKGNEIPAKSGEFFYLDDDGNRQDASLHNEILDNPEAEAAVLEDARERMRKEGWSEKDIARLWGDPCRKTRTRK